jgi:ABC-2 type transport system ATP-binding protein
LKEEKITVFLCTHNLEEASSLSDRVCIINRKIIRIATLSELQNSDKNKRVEIIFGDNALRYTELLKEFKEIKDIQTDNNRVLALVEKPEITNPLIIKKLIDNAAGIIYFNEIKATLEEIYLDLIKNEEEK